MFSTSNAKYNIAFFLFKLISRAQNCWQKEEEYYCLPLFEINLAIKHYAAPLTLVVIALMVPTDVRHTYICIYSIPIRKLAHIRTAKPTSSCHLLSFRTFVKCPVTHSQAASHTHSHVLPHTPSHTPACRHPLGHSHYGNYRLAIANLATLFCGCLSELFRFLVSILFEAFYFYFQFSFFFCLHT